jgi:hypothetical protein
VIGTAVRATEDNLDSRFAGGIGLEWVLRPFLRADENGFGFRYRVRMEHHDYVTANVLGHESMWVPVHAGSAFVRWHTEPFDVGVEIGATQAITLARFWELRGGIETTWRLVGGVQLELSAGLAWRGASIHQPSDPGGLDRAAGLIGGNDFGQIAWEGGLELSYAFGSSLLRAQDQRWR